MTGGDDEDRDADLVLAIVQAHSPDIVRVDSYVLIAHGVDTEGQLHACETRPKTQHADLTEQMLTDGLRSLKPE